MINILTLLGAIKQTLWGVVKNGYFMVMPASPPFPPLFNVRSKNIQKWLCTVQVLTTPHATPTRCSRWEQAKKMAMKMSMKMNDGDEKSWWWLGMTDERQWQGCWRLPPRRRNGGGWRAAWTRRAERAAFPKSSQGCSQVMCVVCQKLLFAFCYLNREIQM